MGAWIEIAHRRRQRVRLHVAPLVGAWIEIRDVRDFANIYAVAPLVGACIEIHDNRIIKVEERSLLSWERGLKYT